MSRRGVVVLDDHFPSKGTGFRIAEFDWLMRHDVVSEVMTTVEPLDRLVAEYAVLYPETSARVSPYDPDRLGDFECASLMFLNNAAYYLPDLERFDLPFALTLYPGGGLNLGDPEAESKLAKVLASPQLSHLITTQPNTTEHIRQIAPPSIPVTEILGGVVNPLYLGPGPGQRTRYFGSGKPVLDICFVAMKYTPDGVDKGFPAFIRALRLLRDRGLPVRGHMVGGFTPGDVPEECWDLELSFARVKTTPELREFYREMDVIIAPNAAGHLAPGGFDGFPTGTCVEAALCGVAVVGSDPLGLNRIFTDRRDIHMPRPDALDVAERVLEMVAEPGGVRRVAQAGLRTVRHWYGIDAQLSPRRRVIESVRYGGSGQPAPVPTLPA